MDAVSAISSVSTVALPVLPPPPDIVPPVVYANEPITAIRLIASMTFSVGETVDASA